MPTQTSCDTLRKTHAAQWAKLLTGKTMLKFLPSIDKGPYRFIDLAVKFASGLGVLAGGAWAVYQYLGGVEIGLRKPLWERQLDLYFQACEAASTLANYDQGSPEWRIAEKRFWTLYWGRWL
jgi:hypothetical protein